MMGREINLLMVSEDGINHHTAIKSLSRLLDIIIIIIYSCLYRDTPSPQVVDTRVPVVKN